MPHSGIDGFGAQAGHAFAPKVPAPLGLGFLPVVAVIASFGWGIVGFGMVPSIQHRVVGLAGPGRGLAATLPAAAVTLGIAIGALGGGRAVGGGADGPMVISLAVCAAGVVAARATSFPEPGPEVVTTPGTGTGGVPPVG